MRSQDLPPYVYKVFKDTLSDEYVAECLEIPGLSGISETESGAISELQEAIAGWLEVLEEDKVPFPPPLCHVEGDFVFERAKNSPETKSTTTSPAFERNYPTILLEHAKQEKDPQIGTSLHS